MKVIIQSYPDELDYVNAKLRGVIDRSEGKPVAGPFEGSFLSAFCLACLRADSENYEFIRPALLLLMDKYPADPERLRAEREDHP